MAVRRVSTPDMYRSSEYYDHTHSYLQGYKIDWSRMSAAQARQSVKGADFTYLESRLNQEGIVGTALEMRPDRDLNMVLELDEGAGVSGQKKIYQRTKFKNGWEYLVNGLLGTWFTAREDRLFRDRHGTQSSAFTEECQKHHCILIIPGKRCYDFSRDDDLATFKQKMEEAAAYLKHIKYMSEMLLKKQARGEWVGGGIIAPYAIDRVLQARMKEYIKQQRQFGLRASDIEITLEMSQASRPVIYQPWAERSLDIFKKIRLFNYETPRLMRYIEEKPYLFPSPPAEDQTRYLFKTHMKWTKGGYTFSRVESVEQWLISLQHLGWMIAGKDEESGEPVYMEDCFQGAIDREQFEETYIQIKGEDLDGNRIERVRNKARFTRAAPTGRTEALLSGCFHTPPEYFVTTNKDGTEGNNYYRCNTRGYAKGTKSEETYLRKTIWTLPIENFDHAIVNRLTCLAEHDKELAERIRKFFATQKESQKVDQSLITKDILALQKKYNHLQWLKTNEELDQTVQQIQELVKDQKDIMRKIDAAKIELTKINEQQPSTAIPRFYDILGDVPGEFWRQDLDHQRKMLRLLIKNIQVENIAPHVYALCVNWIAPVATRGDTALLYRWSSLRGEWTPEEAELLRSIYPSYEKEEILRLFPNRSWKVITSQAYRMELKRARPRLLHEPMHKDLSYNDLVKTCEYYEIAPESKEGQDILWTLNTYAIQIQEKDLLFQWLLPAEKMSLKSVLEQMEGNPIASVLAHWQGDVSGVPRRFSNDSEE